MSIAPLTPAGGASGLKLRGHVTADEAARRTGGYRQLVLYFAEELGIAVARRGRCLFIPQDELPRLGERIRAHLERPRVTRPR
jgi:hypothetical protein